MCGISVLISQDPRAPQILQKMTRLIDHRGPDGEGFWSYQNLFLGHRRLSIIDLSEAGAQPMSYQDRYVITYNGEVYNYREIREELQQQGFQFHSKTDTEVILVAYAAWGKDCLRRLNGMFSFVIFDRQLGTLFGARDRFGVKPFYYHRFADGSLAFASEIKQFTANPLWNPILNKNSARDFLKYGILDATEETFFQGVYQLRGGCYFEISLNEAHQASIQQKRWYDLRQRLQTTTHEQKDVATLLQSSVQLRLRSDVEVGSCLSGGLDSSSLVALMHQELQRESKGHQLKVFSATSERPETDESHYLNLVVQHLNVQCKTVEPNEAELIRILEKLIWHQDEPFGSTSIFAQWKVFELAAQNRVKVMIDGQGSDEQLCGYHSFFGPYWWSLLMRGNFKELKEELRGARELHGYGRMKILKQFLNVLLPTRFLQYLGQVSGRGLDTSRFFMLNSQKDSSLENELHQSTVVGLSLAQIQTTNLPMLLHWEDRNSMAHAIESRVPFLDYRFVENSLSQEDQAKIYRGWTKYKLRKAIETMLPEAVVYRKDKKGFVTAEEHWIRSKNPASFQALMKNSILESKGILKPELEREFNLVLQGKAPYNSFYWRAICFGQWMKVFSVNLNGGSS